MRKIHLLKPGHHIDSRGTALRLTDEELRDMARAYDVTLHEAPIVVGHPRDNAPAYGWVERLSVDDDGLHAEPHQVDPSFAELVQEGRFKKVSASLYTPESPHNPAPGVYYLRHVGFLGAQPPAIKGLRPVTLAEEDAGVVYLSDAMSLSVMARFIKSVREFIIDKFDLDTANNVAPEHFAELLDEAARREEAASAPDPAFGETKLSKMLSRRIDEMTSEDKSRADIVQEMARAAGITPGTVGQILRGEITDPPDERLRGFAKVLGLSFEALKRAVPAETTDNSEPDHTPTMDPKKKDDPGDGVDLAEREAALAEREAALAAREARARRADAVEFLEGLGGRVLPRHVEPLASVLTALDGREIAFSEGDEERKAGAAETLRKFLSELPTLVEYREVSAPGETPVDTSDPVALSREIVAYQEEQAARGIVVSVAEALEAVKKRLA